MLDTLTASTSRRGLSMAEALDRFNDRAATPIGPLTMAAIRREVGRLPGRLALDVGRPRRDDLALAAFHLDSLPDVTSTIIAHAFDVGRQWAEKMVKQGEALDRQLRGEPAVEAVAAEPQRRRRPRRTFAERTAPAGESPR